MILFIDDEPRHMESYLQELEFSDFNVVLHYNVDDALDFFESNIDQIQLIILDIMMPPGKRFKELGSGLRTGVKVFEMIRSQAKEIPVIILTNVSDGKLENDFRTEKNCLFMRKEDYLPFEFVLEIKKLVKPDRTSEGEGIK